MEPSGSNEKIITFNKTNQLMDFPEESTTVEHSTDTRNDLNINIINVAMMNDLGAVNNISSTQDEVHTEGIDKTIDDEHMNSLPATSNVDALVSSTMEFSNFENVISCDENETEGSRDDIQSAMEVEELNNIVEIFKPADSFEHLSDMINVLKEYSNSRGFQFGRRTHKFKNEALQGVSNIDDRKDGIFYCTSCSPGCVFKSASSFKIYFKYDKSKNTYVIKENGYSILHNHSLNNTKEFEGIVNCMKMLSAEEKDLIDRTVKANLKVDELKKFLKVQYPSRSYSNTFLKSILDNNKRRIIGADDNLKLMELGKEIKSFGGIFEVDYDEELTVKCIVISTSTMKQQLDFYSDLIFIDGTYNVNKNKMCLISFTLINNIQKNCIGAVIISTSENSSALEFAMTVLKIPNTAVILTDEHSSYTSFMKNNNMKHILCSFHYLRKAANIARILNDDSTDFLSKIRSIILQKENENVSLQILKELKEKYGNNDKCSLFLSNFEIDKNKVFKCYTAKYFTAGNTANSRSESVNSVIKKNTKLDHKSIYVLVQRIIEVSDYALVTSKQLLDSLVKQKQVVCEKITNKINEEHQLMITCLKKKSMSNGKHIVHDDALQMDFEVIFRKNDTSNHPVCTCPTFTNTYIICRHILRVLDSFQLDWKSPMYLHPRWKISNNPFHKTTKNDAVSKEPKKRNSGKAVSVSDSSPSDVLQRKAALKEMALKVVDFNCEHEDDYKETMHDLKRILKRNLESDTDFMGFLPSPSKRSKGRNN